MPRSSSFSPDGSLSPGWQPPSPGEATTSTKPGRKPSASSDDDDAFEDIDEEEDFRPAPTRGRGGRATRARGSKGAGRGRKSGGRHSNVADPNEPSNKYKDKYLALRAHFDEITEINAKRKTELDIALERLNKVEAEKDAMLSHILSDLSSYPSLAAVMDEPISDPNAPAIEENDPHLLQDPALSQPHPPHGTFDLVDGLAFQPPQGQAGHEVHPGGDADLLLGLQAAYDAAVSREREASGGGAGEDLAAPEFALDPSLQFYSEEQNNQHQMGSMDGPDTKRARLE